MTSPSLVIFGPQSSTPSADKLVQLRSALHANPRLGDFASAVLDLGSAWGELVSSDPALGRVPGQQLLGSLAAWFSKANTSAEPPADFSRLNILHTPLTVIIHVVDYFDYLHTTGLSHAQLLDSATHGNGGYQGFCTGLLAAVSLAAVKDEQDAIQAATAALRLAVALGAYVDLDGLFADPPREFSCLAARWKNPADQARAMKEVDDLPDAYVSAVSDVSTVTVTLPRESQDKLVEKLAGLGVTTRPIPLGGRFHTTAHEQSLAKAVSLGNSNPRFRFAAATNSPALRLVKTGTGSVIDINDATQLHQVVARSMLVDRSEWSTSIRAAVQACTTSSSAVVLGLADCVPRSLAAEHSLTVNHHGAGAKQGKPAYTYPSDAVAIVGLACRFPGADSLDEFWQLLLSRTSMLGKLPAERFPTKGLRRTPKDDIPFLGNFLRDGYAFDNKFFGKSPREAAAMDPQHKLILQVAYEALESAGYFNGDGERATDVGVYAGVAASDYEDNVASHAPTAFSVLGMVRAFVSGKISHFFGLSGPAMVFDTACSSSAVAIHTACQALRAGECSMALAGGVNVITSPILHQNLAAAKFLSPTGASKAFDARADGYCRGEGAGLVVLKRLSAAVADGDRVYGVLAGSAVNQNSNCAPITVPVSESQTAVYRRVLSMGGLPAERVSFVEAHGTGTPKGDPIECASIRDVFGNRPARKLNFGSVKGNIGHTEAASGVAGLIKVLLMMQHRTIPPQASFESLNPSIPPLGPSNMEIALAPTPWTAEFMAACVNNYGAAGSNAALLVLQPPGPRAAVDGEAKAPSGKYPIMITAKSAGSLQAYSRALLEFISSRSGKAEAQQQLLADMAYGLAVRRNPDLPFTWKTTADSLASLTQQLQTLAANPGTSIQETPSSAKGSSPATRPVVLVFSGQTGRTVSLSREAYESSALLQKHLHACDAALTSLNLGVSIFPAVFQRDPIADVVNLHCALFAVQYAVARAWVDTLGVSVAAVVGHSFGQLTALCVAGAVSLADGLKLVAGRAQLIRDLWGAEGGAMLVVSGVAAQRADELVADAVRDDGLAVEVACYNAPTSHVVVGPAADVARFERRVAAGEGVEVKRLEVTHGFHSALVEPILQPFRDLLAEVTFSEPAIPVETCSPGASWGAGVTAELVARQSREPVHFSEAVARIERRLGGGCIWLEAGSGTAAMSLARRALQGQPGVDVSAHSFHSLKLGGADAAAALADATLGLWSAGVSIAQFWPFHRSQQHKYAESVALHLPPYQFEKRHDWLEYVDRHGGADGANSAEAVGAAAVVPEKPTDMVSFSHYADPGKQTTAVFDINQGTAEFEVSIEGHRVLGHPLCPVSLYVEMATRAAALLTPGFATVTHTPSVDALDIFTPLGLDTSRHAQVTLQQLPQTKHAWAFSVHSFPLGSNGGAKKTKHATATVRIVPAAAQDKAATGVFARFAGLIGYDRAAALLADTTASAAAIQGPLVYRMFDKVVNYSGVYRGVQRISSRGAEASGLVTLPRQPGPLDNKALCNPLAVDNFTQVAGLQVNGLEDCGKDDVYICSRVDELRAAKSLRADDVEGGASAGPWLVYSNFTRHGDRELLSDIYVFDAADRALVMTILGVKFTKTSVSLLQKVLARANTGTQQGHVAAVPPKPLIGHVTVAAPLKATSLEASKVRRAESTDSKRRKQEQQQKDAAASRHEVEAAVRQLLHEVADVPPADIRDDTLLADVGIDSLMATEVMTAISDKFSVNLSAAEFQGLLDFKALCAAVQPRLDTPTHHSSSLASTSDDSADEDDGDDQLLASGPSIGTPASSVAGAYEAPERDELVARLQKLVARHLDVDETIAPGLLLADAGVDSLLGIELGADIEKEFGTAIDMMQLTAGSTFGDLTNMNNLLVHAADDFHQIRSDYQRFAREAGWAGFYEHVYPQQRQLVLHYVLEAFAELGCDVAGLPAGATLPPVPHVPKHAKVMGQFAKVLAESSLVEPLPEGDNKPLIRTSVRVDKSVRAEALFQRAVAAHPQHASELKLLRSTGSQLAGVLAGRIDPLQIVFRTKADRDLLEDVYTNSPMFSTGTKLLCNFFRATLARHAAQNGGRQGEPLRILELGAGTGGTTKALLETLAALGVDFVYTFTDLSPSLVAAAKRKFGPRYGAQVEFAVLDVEKAPPAHLLGKFHVALASNCVHATKSLLVSSANTGAMLRPDVGVLALLELTRNLYWLDCVFGLLEGWWLFSDGRKHVLADELRWKDNLLAAGFRHVDWSDDGSKESAQFRLVAGFKAPPLLHLTQQLAVQRLPTKETVEFHRADGVPLMADIYYPDQPDPAGRRRPIALMIHGGGHIMLSRKDIRPRQTRLLLSRGFLPVSIDYRLCPEVTLQSGPMTDVSTALSWARNSSGLAQIVSSHRPDITADSSRVAAVGWSTGGTLAMSLAWTSANAPDAILTFYNPSHYEDAFWRSPNFPEGTTPAQAAADAAANDILEGVHDKPITAYNVPAERRAVGGWLDAVDPRSRIALHMNWRGQALPVLLDGLPTRQALAGGGASDEDKNRNWHHRPQPDAARVAEVSPYAQIVKGAYRTPTFVVHGTADDLVPWQHSVQIKEALTARDVPAGAAIVEGAVHLFDLYRDGDGKGWDAVCEGYEFLCRQVGL
ncbi:hypothetical protein B0T26DRAFT_763988 [Lasiosphaeria miniovina]|uniref:S-adenosyl-L-methionine-dependent N-methyltransferase n=1 Tax=Lasiosphaeria miniovina TaxID=1954250 RepID=A0AA40B349_9PEZI|nr:uncharacterized protein B0T26DRAFT_763988 [Lasiosphaeria miniovina]KAK0726776.1 hypothetical protein B0T26DRAFT_763988 [Lasiosphaeria miniovina]